MDVLSSSLLLGGSLVGLGFFTGLSGAMIPGPMLAFVVSDTLKKGMVAGPLTVLGHITVEFCLILTMVLLGFEVMGGYLARVGPWIYTIGGIALVLISWAILKEARGAHSRRTQGDIVAGAGMRSAKGAYNSSIYGGVLFTAFNPSFIPWWVGIGYLLLLQGFESLALTGIVLVSLGHFLSDLAWYSFVSYSFARGKNFFVGKRYEVIMLVLALFVIALGIFFFVKGALAFF
jgi:threonine/homoserine/homoserine lactone efflux protein